MPNTKNVFLFFLCALGLFFGSALYAQDVLKSFAYDTVKSEITDKVLQDVLSKLKKGGSFKELERQTDIGRDISFKIIARFLAQQIDALSRHLKLPTSSSFEYAVGDQWEVKGGNNKEYKLVVPAYDSYSLVETSPEKMKNIARQVADMLSHKYNIVALNAFLKNHSYGQDTEKVYRYRLEVLKAQVAKKNQEMLSTKMSHAVDRGYSLTTGLAGAVASQFSTLAGYIVGGINTLYGKAAGKQHEVALQLLIDEYVLASGDIDLIAARIQDLEEQVDSEKSSYFEGINVRLPSSLQWGTQGYKGKMLDFFKKYIKENDIELRMNKQFRNKAQNKK